MPENGRCDLSRGLKGYSDHEFKDTDTFLWAVMTTEVSWHGKAEPLSICPQLSAKHYLYMRFRTGSVPVKANC